MTYADLTQGMDAEQVADLDRRLVGITEAPAEDVAASNQAALALLSGAAR